ncbi:MAG: exodeoxyribonuclease VII small subunit [Chloroflexaceae bacterium]|nr:exodeoxyribonuclease VII small subunit [Chloroflexaceae bacterium]NJO04603.1 exodeoxyribonuclease VII small subunit [Chloroflexaceae bacterium]NJO82648.1 exodeoxyribonuclease VII small subunit [Blastochloris sp.]
MTETSTETYETLYTRLQETVAQLEVGNLPLAEALALYEQGVQLAAACQRLLDSAELRVQQLQSDQPDDQ